MSVKPPMVSLPDVRFARPFEVGSLKYWEIVREVMTLTGATREATEAFVRQQKPCLP